MIKIAEIDKISIPYSIVAYGDRIVVTPYTSQGRAADSPTFEVNKNSEVADLYYKDLERIRQSIEDNKWQLCIK